MLNHTNIMIEIHKMDVPFCRNIELCVNAFQTSMSSFLTLKLLSSWKLKEEVQGFKMMKTISLDFEYNEPIEFLTVDFI